MVLRIEGGNSYRQHDRHPVVYRVDLKDAFQDVDKWVIEGSIRWDGPNSPQKITCSIPQEMAVDRLTAEDVLRDLVLKEIMHQLEIGGLPAPPLGRGLLVGKTLVTFEQLRGG